MLKKAYNFTDKKQSKDAVVATIIGGVALAIIIFSLIRAIILDGQVSRIYGLMGVISFILSIAGIYWSIVSYKDEDSLMALKHISMILNVIVLIVSIILFIL